MLPNIFSLLLHLLLILLHLCQMKIPSIYCTHLSAVDCVPVQIYSLSACCSWSYVERIIPEFTGLVYPFFQFNSLFVEMSVSA